MPTFSLFGKLRTVFQHGIFKNIDVEVMKKQDKAAGSFNRRRQSLFRISVTEKISKGQNARFTRPIKLTVFSLSLIYVLVLVVMTIVQLGNLSFLDTCDATLDSKNIWNEGCVNKIPYCKSAFVPKCNCASLKIENDPMLTYLPNVMVDEMDGLRKVSIKNCNLTTLPANMERWTEMVDFEVPFNRLDAFDVDVSKWKKLVRLMLVYNNIKKYKEEALWTHPNLVSLFLNDNVGLNMPGPEITIEMQSLQYFSNSNNTVDVHLNFDKIKFPNLMFLYLRGNNLKTFPDESLKYQLRDLGIARCKLLVLPSYLSDFTKLQYLDSRDNNITQVDDNLKVLIKKNGVESYFSGNPVCQNDEELDCQPLCSKYCWSRNVGGDGYCDIFCNSEKCQYDGGDCGQN